jgi:hypothetical protein
MPLASLPTPILIIYPDVRVFDLNHAFQRRGQADRGEHRQATRVATGATKLQELLTNFAPAQQGTLIPL